MEQHEVTGIAHSANEARILLRGVSDQPGFVSKLLGPIADANIEVDMIVQNVAINGLTDFAFTVQRSDLTQTLNILNPVIEALQISEVLVDAKVAKLSLVGVGMRSHAGIANKMFKILGNLGVHIQLISTSEIKVSVILDEKYIELGLRALHEGFGLDHKLAPESPENNKKVFEKV